METRPSNSIMHKNTGTVVQVFKKTEPCIEIQSEYSMHARKEKSMSTEAYQQKIQKLEEQKAELLEVNKQWDQQFRQMKLNYENKVAELKEKLPSYQHNTKEDQCLYQKDNVEKNLGKDQCISRMNTQDKIHVEFQEIKEENQQLRKQNALLSKRKAHYESEISRLNEALFDIIKKDNFLRNKPCLMNSDATDMPTQIEVLKQQIQIYEEDFKRERADRERINEEKEELQKMNERLQLQLQWGIKENVKLQHQEQLRIVKGQARIDNYRAVQIKRSTKEEFKCRRKQVKPDYQWFVPDQLPPDVLQKENGVEED
ncbi:TNFAIP3-interacting protein 3 [Rhinophrynus dorsalis]